jgi:cytosine/uracil/thiamine/allantoin permease
LNQEGPGDMRTVLAIAAALLLVAVMALVIWAAELARPTMHARRQLADDERA